MKLLTSLFFPPRCPVCGTLQDFSKDPIPLCDDCMEKWISAELCRCKKCSRDKDYCICDPIYNTSGAIDRFYRLISYYPNMRAEDVYDLELMSFSSDCMTNIKNMKDREYIKFLAYQMALYIKRLFSDTDSFYITFPPRSLNVRLSDGFDIGAVLASYVSELTDIQYFKNVKRIKLSSQKQKQLNMVQRGEHSVYSFALTGDAEKSVKNSTFIIIDDIVTTGATTTCLASVLKKHGATRVYCMSASRTIYFNKAKDR